MIKVLYLSHEGDEMKGASFSLINLINSVAGEVKPVIIVPSNGAACRQFEKLGFEYYIVPFKFSFTDKKGIKRLLTFLPRYLRDALHNSKAKKEIARIVKQQNIQIIHSNTLAVGIGNAIAKATNTKHVWHVREFLNHDFSYEPLIGWKAFRAGLLRSDAIICITRAIADNFNLNGNLKVQVLNDAVRKLSSVKPINFEKQDYFLFCGNVAPPKGIETAIDAFAVVHKTYPQLKLIVAGPAKEDYQQKLNQMVAMLNVAAAVQFLGFTENVDSLMADALALLMCSQKEAQGRVTVEAMFNGCPVIGYASGGTLEIVKPGQTGFLYHNSRELVEKMLHVAEHQSQLNDILTSAQKFAGDNFSEEQYGLAISSLYSNLIK